MWKRENEPAPNQPHSAPPSTPPASPRQEIEAPVPRATAPAAASRAVIGPSLELTGELSGSEDLFVEGKIQGKIRLPQHAVTVGAKGRVSAEVQARILEIEGEVDGHLSGEELIVLRKSARVRGDLTAPRVVIEDGARFKGTIDMEPKRAQAASGATAAGPRPLPAEESSRSAGSAAAAIASASATPRAS